MIYLVRFFSLFHSLISFLLVYSCSIYIVLTPLLINTEVLRYYQQQVIFFSINCYSVLQLLERYVTLVGCV